MQLSRLMKHSEPLMRRVGGILGICLILSHLTACGLLTKTQIVIPELPLPDKNKYIEGGEFLVLPLEGSTIIDTQGNAKVAPKGGVAVYIKDLLEVSTNLKMCLIREVQLEEVITTTHKPVVEK